MKDDKFKFGLNIKKPEIKSTINKPSIKNSINIAKKELPIPILTILRGEMKIL